MLDEDRILVDLKAKDKKRSLKLSEVIAGGDALLEKSALVKVLLERERLGSTGIGDGVPIPIGNSRASTSRSSPSGEAVGGWISIPWTVHPPICFFPCCTRKFCQHSSEGPRQDSKDPEKQRLP